MTPSLAEYDTGMASRGRKPRADANEELNRVKAAMIQAGQMDDGGTKRDTNG
jgi:hypothetical protein